MVADMLGQLGTLAALTLIAAVVVAVAKEQIR